MRQKPQTVQLASCITRGGWSSFGLAPLRCLGPEINIQRKTKEKNVASLVSYWSSAFNNEKSSSFLLLILIQEKDERRSPTE